MSRLRQIAVAAVSGVSRGVSLDFGLAGCMAVASQLHSELPDAIPADEDHTDGSIIG